MKNSKLETVVASGICLVIMTWLMRSDVYSAKLVGMTILIVMVVVITAVSLGRYARSRGVQIAVRRKRMFLVFTGLGVLMLVMTGLDLYFDGVGGPGWKGPFAGALLFGLVALRTRFASS